MRKELKGWAYVIESEISPDAYLCIDTADGSNVVLKIGSKRHPHISELIDLAAMLNEWRQGLVGEQLRLLRQEIEEVRKMSTSTLAGLQALTATDAALAQAVSDNTTAQQAVLDELQALLAQTSQSEDPQVQALAADMQGKVDLLIQNTRALQSAAQPPAPAPTPVPEPTPAPVSGQEAAAQTQAAEIGGMATDPEVHSGKAPGESVPMEAGKVHHY